MTRAILGFAALLAVAAALAGCGGGGSASGTTGSVAGAHHGAGSGSFRASIHGFAAQLQTSVQAFRRGNLTKAMMSGGPVLNNCMGFVDTKIAPRATTPDRKQALAHLRSACGAMTQAANAASSGNTTRAKQLARTAVAQARIAARLSG
jgi:hypothetical protein